MDVFEALSSRRSIKLLVEPAPSPAELQQMLEAAVLAPDHHELRPWQFLVLRGEAKSAFTSVLVEALHLRNSGATQGQIDKASRAMGRAPVVIAVAAKRLPDAKIPFLELYAATCAAAQNLLLAATALGYGSIWRTGAPATDPNVKRALGLDADDEIVGFIYLGTIPPKGTPPPRPAVLDGVVEEWQPLS